MWFPIFFLLGIAWVGHGQSICEKNVENICEIPEEAYSYKFPQSIKKMETFCSKMIPFAECVADYQEKCSSPQVMPLKLVQSLLNAGKAFCVQDSAWFKGAAKFGNCFEDFKQNVPSNFARDCSNKIEEDPMLSYLNDPNNHPELNRCYYGIETASCAAKKISEDCGKPAKELALHFIRLAGPWNFICQDYQNEATKLMKDLDFTFDPETSEDEFATLLQS